LGTFVNNEGSLKFFKTCFWMKLANMLKMNFFRWTWTTNVRSSAW